MGIEVRKHSRSSKGEYIGRSGKNPSPLANEWAFRLGTRAKYVVASREESMDRYSEWLDNVIRQADSEAFSEFLRLVNNYMQHGKLVLLCHCNPLPCHGDIIAEQIEEYVEALQPKQMRLWHDTTDTNNALD